MVKKYTKNVRLLVTRSGGFRLQPVFSIEFTSGESKAQVIDKAAKIWLKRYLSETPYSHLENVGDMKRFAKVKISGEVLDFNF